MPMAVVTASHAYTKLGLLIIEAVSFVLELAGLEFGDR